MGTMTKQTWMKKAAALSILPISAFGLTACNTEGPEQGTDVEDISEGDVAETSPAPEETEVDPAVAPYDGPYDQNFYDEADAYVGQEVTVSAEVTETLSDDTFVIAGAAGTAVDPLLIVEMEEIPPLDEGQVVQLTGTVQQGFDIVAAEEELGIDLDDELYADYEGQPYLEATSGEILEDE